MLLSLEALSGHGELGGEVADAMGEGIVALNHTDQGLLVSFALRLHLLLQLAQFHLLLLHGFLESTLGSLVTSALGVDIAAQLQHLLLQLFTLLCQLIAVGAACSCCWVRCSWVSTSCKRSL